MIDPQSLRASLSDALAELERTRHAAQRLLFLLLQAEGQTLADIGRALGISRQLVSRMVNEPDPDAHVITPSRCAVRLRWAATVPKVERTRTLQGERS